MTPGFLRSVARTAHSGLGLAGLGSRLDRIDNQLTLLRDAAAAPKAASGYVTLRLPAGTAYELSIDASGADEYHTAVAAGRLNEEQTWCFLMDWLRPGETLFDLGANIGTFSIAAGVLGVAVHAFEMMADNIVHLQRAARRNRLHNVTIVQAAVSDGAGIVGIAGVSAWGSVVSDGMVKVPALSIDEYVGSASFSELHTIKIDIEGSEYQALVGATATLSRFKPDIIIESNTFQCGAHDYSYRDCLRLLLGLGYGIYRLHWGRLSPWNVDALQEIAVVDYFATTKSPEAVSSRSQRMIMPITADEMVANIVDTANHSDTHRRHVLAIARKLPDNVTQHERVGALLKAWQPLACGPAFDTMLTGSR